MRKNRLILLLMVVFWGLIESLNAQTITLYDECVNADLNPVVTPGTGSFVAANTYQNANANVTAGFTASALGLPTCPTVTPANLRDAWVRFTANSTSMVISYTPTVTDDVALVVYSAATGCPVSVGAFLQCGNAFGAGFTESVTISATIGQNYYLRVVQVSGGSGMNGRVSFYTGPRSLSAGDLCTDANSTALTLGTTSCNVPFDINSRFVHNEKFTNAAACPPSSTTSTNFIDGWARITLTANQSIRVSYLHTNKDAQIMIYSGTCGNLTQVACGNNTGTASGTGLTEFADYTATAAGTYLIRVINMTDRTTMTGSICINELVARDNCVNAIDGIKIGDCNVPFDVPASNAATPTSVSNRVGSLSDTRADSWLTFVATTTETLVLEMSYNSTVGAQPAIGVYEFNGTVAGFCGSLGGGSLFAPTPVGITNPLDNFPSAPSGSILFNVTAGRRYFIRVVNNSLTNLLSTNLCLYRNNKKAEDFYFSANNLNSDGSDCGIQFNLLSSFDGDGTVGTALNSINCLTNKNAFNDGWSKFTPPGSGNYVIEYNNDNKSSTVANDIMLSVYRIPVVNLGADMAGRGAATGAGATTRINGAGVNGSVTGTVSTTTERWYRVAAAKDFDVRFEVTSGTGTLEIIDDDGSFTTVLATAQSNNNLLTVQRNTFGGTSSGSEFYIKLTATSGTFAGNLTIYYAGTDVSNLNGSNFVLVGCADNVIEGVESLTFSGASTVANNHYFIRVANKITLTSTTGTLCIRNDAVPQGDLCSNATPLLVGSCDVNFDITAAFTSNQPLPQLPTCSPTGITSVTRDGWMSFTATSTQTTIEFQSDQNIALAIYRGSCSNLIFVDCKNAVIGEGIESIKINSIVGITYYIRVISFAPNSVIEGRVCIYNNNERDACDDDDLVTRVVGDCNLPFDVPASFDNSPGNPTPPGYLQFRDFTAGFPVTETGGSITQFVTAAANSTCDSNPTAADSDVTPTQRPDQTAAKDAWIRIIGNGGDVTLIYQNREATSNPSMIVYTALKAVGPVNCGSGLDGAGNPQNQYACSNRITTPSIQTESVTFATNSGQLYLIRILDLTGTGMTGRLCISSGSQNYENPCATVGPDASASNTPRQVSVGQCSIPLNIVNGLNTCSFPPTFTNTPSIVTDLLTQPFSGSSTPAGWTATGDWNDSNSNNSTGYSGASGGRNFRISSTGISSQLTTPLINTTGYTNITVIWGARLSGVVTSTLEWRIGAGAYTPVTFTNVANNSTWALVNGGTRISLPAGAENISNLQIRLTVTLTSGSRYSIDDFMVQGTSVASPVPSYNGISGTDCVGGDKSCSVADVWATVTIPSVCSSTTAATFTTSTTCTGAGYSWNASTNRCECPANTIRPTFANNFTIQYDNRDGLITGAADVKLVVYDASVAGFDCNNQDTYRCVGFSDNVGEGLESVNIQFSGSPSGNLAVTFPTPGRRYLIRIINKDATQSAFGTLCLMYGTSLSSTTCPPPNCYGELEGEFTPFNVAGGTYAGTSVNNVPSQSIAGCVVPGGSTPASDGTNPIRSQGWMAFTVPANASYTAVTVQYTNDLTSGNDPNAAIAIYTAPNMAVQTNPVVVCPTVPGAITCNAVSGDPNGLQFISCSNSVYQGPESTTFNIIPGRTYFVRVMNVDAPANPNDLNGLIRVFPYARCSPGPELVTDGKFDMWPAIATPSGIADNFAQTQGVFDSRQNAYVLQTPNVDSDDAYPNALDNNATTGIARFATDYGFLRDVSNTGVPVMPATSLTYAQATSEQGELNPEGYYLIRQTPWVVKGDWFGYGNGYSGYGGRQGWGTTDINYCASGQAGRNQEPCSQIYRGQTFGSTNGWYNDSLGVNTSYNRPRALPHTRDANFMIVNGSYDPNGGLPPGKVWCQTIDRGASAGKVGYYIFSVWVQNMISGGRNLDVPMMRMTVCDMEDPVTGALPALSDLDPSAGVRNSRLPGVTDVLASGAVLPQVQHFPRPPVNRVKAPRVDFSYGAAMSCNTSSESRDRRLKTLGTSFLVTETPDKWKPIRCVYRAPANVTEMNICLENLSLTKNGNDFAIDDISFYECLNPDAETFDKLLKGDPCELTDNPQNIDILLGASILDLSGKLVGDKVLLNWLVAREDKTVKYDVQRSHDGTNFYTIGSVDARGMQAGTTEYSYTDRNLPLGAKTLYYRLNIIETNGYSRFSYMISVDINAIETFDVKLVPNAVETNQDVEVRFNVPEGNTQIGVFNMMGNPLMISQMKTNNGENVVIINTKGMIAGLYLIKIIHNGRAVTKKLVVK